MDTQKEQIADVFQKHFNHFGFKKTSVDQVARELQISKKTIYQHFTTKEEVLYYVVSRVARQYMQKMARELEGLPTYADKMTQLVGQIFKETKKWLKTNDAFEFRYKQEIGALAFQDAYQELFKTLIAQGQQHGEFSVGDPETTALFVKGIIAQSMQVLHTDPRADVEAQTVQAILKLLR